MSLLSPSTIMLFGSGMKGVACAVVEAAESSNPASPIAITVFGIAKSFLRCASPALAGLINRPYACIGRRRAR
jgi:hypothetical protein